MTTTTATTTTTTANMMELDNLFKRDICDLLSMGGEDCIANIDTYNTTHDLNDDATKEENFWRDLLICDTTYEFVCSKLEEIFSQQNDTNGRNETMKEMNDIKATNDLDESRSPSNFVVTSSSKSLRSPAKKWEVLAVKRRGIIKRLQRKMKRQNLTINLLRKKLAALHKVNSKLKKRIGASS